MKYISDSIPTVIVVEFQAPTPTTNIGVTIKDKINLCTSPNYTSTLTRRRSMFPFAYTYDILLNMIHTFPIPIPLF